MYKEAIIYFKDGTKGCVDPVYGEEDIKYYDNIIVICNGYQSYDFDRYDVEKIEVVDIEEK